MREAVIRTKIKEIQESVSLVQESLPGDFDEFEGLGLVKDGIYKRLEFCIENVFDVCAIINSDLELGIPGGDEEIVDNLVKADVFDDNMKDRLKAMKGFRNIIVHRYGRIDDKIAFQILTNNIEDFDEFIEMIERFLENKQDRD